MFLTILFASDDATATTATERQAAKSVSAEERKIATKEGSSVRPIVEDDIADETTAVTKGMHRRPVSQSPIRDDLKQMEETMQKAAQMTPMAQLDRALLSFIPAGVSQPRYWFILGAIVYFEIMGVYYTFLTLTGKLCAQKQ